MKLTVRCRSGLRIDFEGSLEELERFDGFLAELARLERDRLAPAPHDAIRAAVASPHVVAFEPFPDPSPPTPLGVAAEPDGGDRRPDTQAADTAGESSRPPARSSPPAGGTGRPAHSRDAVLGALRALGPSKVKAISEHTGLTPKAIEQVLYRQRVNGTVVHNGVRGPGSRWSLADAAPEDFTRGGVGDSESLEGRGEPEGRDAEQGVASGEDQPSPAIAAVDPPVVRRQQSPHEGRVIGASARAAMDAQRDARHDGHHDQVIALVAEHGPVAPAWVADQLVKNRRDTAALMRDMAAAGELVEQDAGGYDIPDRDDQDLAA